jgi:hypothetical protein
LKQEAEALKALLGQRLPAVLGLPQSFGALSPD